MYLCWLFAHTVMRKVINRSERQSLEGRGGTVVETDSFRVCRSQKRRKSSEGLVKLTSQLRRVHLESLDATSLEPQPRK